MNHKTQVCKINNWHPFGYPADIIKKPDECKNPDKVINSVEDRMSVLYEIRIYLGGIKGCGGLP